MKTESIKKRKNFLIVAKNGQKIVTKGLVFQAVKNDDNSESRLGVTVTKKIGCAVVRNKAKRRLRRAFEEAFKGIQINGFDFVAIGRYCTCTRDFEKLVADFRYALKNIKT